MKVIFLLIASLVIASSVWAQTSFSAAKDFRYPIPIPRDLVPLLQSEITEHCTDSEIKKQPDIDMWFLASYITLSANHKAIIVEPKQAGFFCLNAIDSDIFRVYLKIRNRYKKVLESSASEVRVLHTKHNGLHDLRFDVWLAGWVMKDTFQYDGETYKGRKCTARMLTPPEVKQFKEEKVPCRF